MTQFCLRTAEILLVCMHGAQIKCKSWQCRRRVTREHVLREHEKGHERASEGVTTEGLTEPKGHPC